MILFINVVCLKIVVNGNDFILEWTYHYNSNLIN